MGRQTNLNIIILFEPLYNLTWLLYSLLAPSPFFFHVIIISYLYYYVSFIFARIERAYLIFV